jgi:hypothetical protein
MNVISRMLILLDREPSVGPQAFILSVLANVQWDGKPFGAYMTPRARVTLQIAEKAGTLTPEDPHLLAAVAIERFKHLWGTPPNFENLNYQFFRGTGGNGACLVEWESVATATVQPEAPPQPGRSLVRNLIDVLLSPPEAFTALVAKPGFWLPLLLQVALAVGFTAVWTQKVDTAEFLKNQLVESGRWDKIPAEQRPGILETQSKFIPIFAWVGGLVAGPIAVLVIAAALMFVFRFFYAGEVTFRQSMTLVAYSMLAYALVTTPLVLLVMSLKGDWNLNPQEVLQANATLFLDRDSVAKPLWALAGSLDLFVFWAIWLLATGFGVAVKRDTRSALWGVVVPWLLVVAIKVGFTALSALS